MNEWKKLINQWKKINLRNLHNHYLHHNGKNLEYSVRSCIDTLPPWKNKRFKYFSKNQYFIFKKLYSLYLHVGLVQFWSSSELSRQSSSPSHTQVYKCRLLINHVNYVFFKSLKLLKWFDIFLGINNRFKRMLMKI